MNIQCPMTRDEVDWLLDGCIRRLRGAGMTASRELIEAMARAITRARLIFEGERDEDELSLATNRLWIRAVTEAEAALSCVMSHCREMSVG